MVHWSLPTLFVKLSAIITVPINPEFGSLNLGAASVLMFGLYYRRHHNRDTAVSALLLNVFVFAVLTVLADVQFSLAAGFGLFAILALFTLRSEQLSRVDIAYFFGSASMNL